MIAQDAQEIRRLFRLLPEWKQESFVQFLYFQGRAEDTGDGDLAAVAAGQFEKLTPKQQAVVLEALRSQVKGGGDTTAQ